MQNEPFVIEQVYDVPPEKVWNAITSKDEMKQWYFDIERFEPEVGFNFSFTGTGTDGTVYVHHCRITHVEKFRRLRYSWAYENRPGMSYVTFELFPEGEGTRLRLTHEGLETFQGGGDFSKESFAAGWTEITGKLLRGYLGSK